MPNGFLFNNKHSSTTKIKVLKINRPLLPTLRKRELQIAGRDGVYDFGGNTYENNFITVECALIEDNKADLIKEAREVAKWLRNKGSLIFDEEPNKQYIGRIYSSVPLVNLATTGRFTLMFEVEPYAYSEVNLIEVTRTDETPLFVTNSGNIKTPPIITITNTGTSPINGFTIRLIITK